MCRNPCSRGELDTASKLSSPANPNALETIGQAINQWDTHSPISACRTGHCVMRMLKSCMTGSILAIPYSKPYSKTCMPGIILARPYSKPYSKSRTTGSILQERHLAGCCWHRSDRRWERASPLSATRLARLPAPALRGTRRQARGGQRGVLDVWCDATRRMWPKP
jgi:hypothetical protein